ncbi:MAG: sigma-70 family RNA polymerase sigma factor [Deltaproteobacteria bacterium]|nr:sigma-70 family RNA polymerase sigma factor [Deltaproteobacteria bacterium]
MSWIALQPSDPLLDRARNGDAAALEQLLVSIAPAVHRFGLRMCGSDSDAQDVLQETLISIATHVSRFEGKSALSSWVFALARNACIKKRRGRKNQQHLGQKAIEAQSASASSPEQRAENRELWEVLTRALDGLPEQYREAVVLRDIEGLSAAQAAGALGISVDALKSRLHRAREALRKELMPLLEPRAPAPSAQCPDMATLWSRKLEGDLDKQDCAEIEKHVAECPACGAICDALKKALLACQSSATAEIRPEVQAQVKAAMRALTGLGGT